MKWYDMVWHGIASMKFKVCYSTISCFADVERNTKKAKLNGRFFSGYYKYSSQRQAT